MPADPLSPRGSPSVRESSFSMAGVLMVTGMGTRGCHPSVYLCHRLCHYLQPFGYAMLGVLPGAVVIEVRTHA